MMLHAIALALQGWTPSLRPELLDPTTVTSASGAHELRIDPSSQDGSGPGVHELRSGGERRWRLELPFTLWRAVVTDAGTVAGYAYSNGVNGPVPGERYFHVLLVAPDGSILCDEAVERPGSRGPEQPDRPRADGLLVWEDLDRVAVRVVDGVTEHTGEEWWTYRLSDGEELGVLFPEGAIPAHQGRSGDVCEAVRVPGTPLVLLRRRAWGTGWQGSAYALVDADAQPVWWHVTRNESERTFASLAPRVVAVGERSFSLRDGEHERRIDFAVERAADGWTARETGRAPLAPDGGEDEVGALPELVLERLPSVLLVQAAGADADPDLPPEVLRTPGSVAVAWDGTILVQDRATANVLVLGRTGELLRVCRADPSLAADVPFGGALALSPDGVVEAVHGHRALAFDATGACLGLRDALVEHPLFDAAGQRWGWAFREVTETDGTRSPALGGVVALHPSGLAARRYRRRPGDERWLRGGPFAVARDGSLAVASEGLALFPVNGEPARTVRLPLDAERVAWNGRWAALAPYGGPLLLVRADAAGATVHRFAPSELVAQGIVRRRGLRVPASEHRDLTPALCEPGELWVVESEATELVLHRYALPEGGR